MKARNIKPGFFKNEDLADCSFAARLLFIGLWCMADRNGMVEYRPRKIKAEIFPYDDKIDTKKLLKELSKFVRILSTSENPEYIHIIKFNKNQSPHRNEKELQINNLDKLQEITGKDEKLRSPLMNDECLKMNDERGMMNDESAQVTLCFDSVWNRYPNKTGKGRAKTKFKSSVKNGEDYSLINKALDNYLLMLSIPTNSWRKPQDGSTWFNNWHDWVEWEPSEHDSRPQMSNRELTNHSAMQEFLND